MKKIFSIFAAMLMAGSMMAGSQLISFTEPVAAGALNGQTIGEGFELTITDTGNKVSIDRSSATFGISAEETVTFGHRLKSGGKSSSANHMTLTIPEEGMLVICARPSSASATDRNFVIANGSDTIVNHICLDTDTVEGASSKIFLPVVVENVPAGTYTLTYPVNGINFYGFELVGDDAPVNYWLVGPAAENGWDQTRAMPMPGDQIVRHLAAGTYAFKVLTQEASWTGALGAADVNATASSANWYGDDNINFELENEGDVTIKVVEGQIVLLGTFKEQVEYDYYIKFAGNNWTWVGMDMAPSGVYMYEGVWGGTGANVNTSMSDNGAAWYPEADIIFGTLEMEELPVPAVGTVGYYAYFPEVPALAFVYEATPTALQSVEAAKVQKTIENGQIVILRDGKRYNAVGAEL